MTTVDDQMVAHLQLVLPMLLVFLVGILLSSLLPVVAANAQQYYTLQTNFAEKSVPMTAFHWGRSNLDSCIYKQEGVPNFYYVWTKLAVQSWRQALKEYSGDSMGWSITARHVSDIKQLESCTVKIYILSTYKSFPGYPNQTGAYTTIVRNSTNIDVRVYLSPEVLHGDGKTVIQLPDYAFRNSARHEIGHMLGLGHMRTEEGYLMSPVFDYWHVKHELPITTLELKALTDAYGHGFS